ncbi:MAG: FAD-binding oxidoreductase, partial [Kiloniellales bacterium]|nr:FAD-binding oxidoreductase [Kiloniellales bacterium]
MADNGRGGPMIESLKRKLLDKLAGEVHFDLFSRGRYATDASIYQMMPLGVVIPRGIDDLRRTLDIAREEGIPILPRGGGTSQCGQTVNEALVIDNSKYLNRILELDAVGRRCVVEPGIVLDELNRVLKPHGLWFPVDVSTSSRATIGGMTANNSCGSRSIRYGLMRDNVLGIDALLANGLEARFGPTDRHARRINDPSHKEELLDRLFALGDRERDEIAVRFPKVMRRVGGYNIDALVPNGAQNNLAHLLVGSEGTLAYSTKIELQLSSLPKNKVLGLCHFPTFYDAMDAAQHLVRLGPTAVELIDKTMIDLARDIPLYRKTIEAFVRGEPEALLMVEFAEEEQSENLKRLKQLSEQMGDLGFSWENPPSKRGGVIEAIDPGLQSDIMEVRKSGLNIMMSMKEERKPIS